MNKFSIMGFRATKNRKKRIHGAGWNKSSKGGKLKKNADWFNPLAYLFNKK